SPWGTALDTTSVYWTENSGAALMKMPLAGGAAVMIGASAGGSGVGGLATDGVNAYWASPGNGLLKVPTMGGAATPLGSGSINGPGIASDTTYIYWARGSSLARASISGGAPVVLALGQTITGVVLDATHVYWTDTNAGTVSRVAK